MKKNIAVMLIAILTLSLIVTGCKSNKGDQVETNDLEKNASYIIGNDFGQRFKQQGVTLSIKDFVKGLEDGMTDGIEPKFTDEEIQQIMQEYQTMLMEKSQKEAEERKQVGADYLEKNKANKGVVTLPSGLQYKVLTEGTGNRPTLTDMVTTHYKGTLIDGTEFDSSYSRGEPATFPVNGVIAGWTEALQLMKEGAKWELYIPSDLAYGSRATGSIPANSVLIFEIELLKVEAAQNDTAVQ